MTVWDARMHPRTCYTCYTCTGASGAMTNLSSIPLHEDANILEQICGVFARYIDAKPHHIVGLALWALHTHIYRQYDKSPRLAILSPVPNCGKSTVLNILHSMVANPEKLIDPTIASTFRLAGDHTLLLDEVDNMSIMKSMKAILNNGHELGGSVPRTGKNGEVIKYPVYGPLALAGIGRLPVTLMSRSIIIPMHRSTLQQETFNPRIGFYLEEIARWAELVSLDPNPRMPAQIIGRDADKWRPLIAIGKALDRSLIAYEAMAGFFKEAILPDIKESLLRDIHEVFIEAKTNILTNEMLLDRLLSLEYSEVDWSEHKLTKTKIARILTEFQIANRMHRYQGGTPARCWFAVDFEEMWQRYA
jgi:Protein of unknown function (DUF3631)